MKYNSIMKKGTSQTLLILGIFLLANGIGNIIDDSRVLTYDITSILSGIGFIAISKTEKNKH